MADEKQKNNPSVAVADSNIGVRRKGVVHKSAVRRSLITGLVLTLMGFLTLPVGAYADAVDGVSCRVKVNKMQVIWNPFADAVAYQVTRHLGGVSTQVAEISGNTLYLDQGLGRNTAYTYTVKARLADGSLSKPSEPCADYTAGRTRGRPPVINITSSPVRTATEGESYVYQVAAVAPSGFAYTLAHGPSGMTMSSTGLLEWQPGVGDAGYQVVTFFVSGRGLKTSLQTWLLNIEEDTSGPVDNNPPTIVAMIAPPANANGWHNTPVTVTFDCSDDVGIASCTGPVLIDTDGAGQVVSGTAVDLAGNTASTAVTINLDTVPPPLTVVLDPSTDTTPPGDQVTLLQRVNLLVQSEAFLDVQLFATGSGGPDVLLDSATADAQGAVVFTDLSLSVGDNPYRLRVVDLADNATETPSVVERLQCVADPQNQSFFINATLASGAPATMLDPTMNDFAGVYEQFRSNAVGLDLVTPGLINGDVLVDWVTLDGNRNGVEVFINDGSPALSPPQFYATGSTPPVAAGLRDLIGNSAVDLVVGHEDGQIVILEGRGDGMFETTPTLTFSAPAPLRDLKVGDADADGDADILLVSPGQAQLALNVRNQAGPPTFVIVNGDFTRGLIGWQVNAVGQPVNAIAGQISIGGAGAALLENDSFLVTLSQTFEVSPDGDTLSFELSQIDLGALNEGVPDALEVSLLDSASMSVVPTINAQATSFLNIAPDGNVRAAPGVTYNGGRAEVDISSVSGEVTLYFDLVGNPPGRTSTFTVANVDAGQSAPVTDEFQTLNLDAGLSDAAGGVICTAVSPGIPILISDPGGPSTFIYTRDAAGSYQKGGL